jgi:hypothetical protein
MNLVQDLFTSRTLNRWLPWIAGLVLLAGVATFVAVKWTNTADSLSAPVSKQPAVVPKPEPASVKASPEAKTVAAQFIANAVSLDFRNRDTKPSAADRAKLAKAWKISGGPIKEGTPYKAWLKGDIPVVPYPARANAGLQVEYSHRNAIEFVFALLPKKGFKTKPQYFLMDLSRVGKQGAKHWIVTYWAPQSPPTVLVGPDG